MAPPAPEAAPLPGAERLPVPSLPLRGKEIREMLLFFLASIGWCNGSMSVPALARARAGALDSGREQFHESTGRDSAG